MGPGPIARWLDTFLSNRQYAELFKRYGFETLNDVSIYIYRRIETFIGFYLLLYINKKGMSTRFRSID